MTEQFGPKAPRRLSRLPWLGLALLALLVLIRFADPSAVERVRLTFFDYLQSILPRSSHSGSVVVVDIDEASLQSVGQWPWPRSKLAELTTALATLNPKVVGYDVLFPEPDRLSPGEILRVLPPVEPAVRDQLLRLPSTDGLLAASFGKVRVVLAIAADPLKAARAAASSEAPPSVVAATGPEVAAFLTRFDSLISSLPELESAAAGRGAVTLVRDADGVARRMAGAVVIGGIIYPSLTVEMLRVASGADRVVVESGPSGIEGFRVGSHRLPSDGRGNVWLSYSRTAPVPILSAVDLLAGRVPADAVAGKLVLVGSTAAGVDDNVATPFGSRLSGLEIHAQLLDGMLAGQLLRRSGHMVTIELVLLIVAGVIVMVAGRQLPGWRLLPFVLGIIALIGATAVLLYARERLLLDPTFPAVAAVLLYMMAVTEAILAEERARRKTEEQLRDALLRAEAASKAKSDFLANMSHELRTPLTAILGFSETMQSGIFGPITPARYADYVNEIHNSGNRLLTIVSDVLEMSRIETGEAKLEDSAVDLGEAVADCLEMLRPRSHKKRLTMETQIAPNLPRLRGDKRMVKQMLLHLLTNAVTFTPDGGGVTLSAGVDGEGRISVAVRDTGIGMSRADMARAIEPFQTVERPQARSFQGVGLGLPLTRSMIELHGGTLALDSEPNAGTLATLTFPAERTIRNSA